MTHTDNKTSAAMRKTTLYREWELLVWRTLGRDAKTTPSRAALAVLRVLDKEPGGLWGSEIARRIGQGQPNTTNLTLPRLEQMGLIEYSVQANPRGGGRPLNVWRLTEKGRDFGILASVESHSGIHSSERSDSMSGVRVQKRHPRE
jgi:DNA-binding MarR family transcriptional regulator